MLTSSIKFWLKIKRILLSFGLWRNAVDLKLKLLSSFFNVVSELFRFNVSENLRSITLFWGVGLGGGGRLGVKSTLKMEKHSQSRFFTL